MRWVYDSFHNEWWLIDCDGGMLAIVGQASNGFWSWKGQVMILEIARYEATKDVLDGKCGTDIQRRAIKT